MTPPAFWQTHGPLARALSPVAALVAAVTARRVTRPGLRLPVPVCCVGNVSVGGSGKTPVVLDLAARLTAAGATPHILSRGYGGRVRGPHRVTAADTAADVGDEAPLLARAAPTWVGADRVASARLAIAQGADILLMDDGMQNPTLHKTIVVLVIDPAGLGNRRVLPAGPLREPLAAGLFRADWVVRFGQGVPLATPPPTPPSRGGEKNAPSPLEGEGRGEGWPAARADGQTLHARLAPGPDAQALAGRRVFAFAGIGRPEKFFASLREAGANVTGTRTFPDHHPYTAADLTTLKDAAGTARPVTTAKDAVRLPPWPGLAVADVTVAWTDLPDALVVHMLASRAVAAQAGLGDFPRAKPI